MNWESKYEFGIPEMDKQHRKWLEILNNFYDGVSKGDLKDKMLLLVDEALKYTKYHFDEEEKFLAKLNYPNIAEQKKMHQAIIATLTNYKKEISGNKNILSMAVTNELKKWFKDHILIEDMKYADFLKKAKA
jgi:hemerythrin-like metal-binding protein